MIRRHASFAAPKLDVVRWGFIGLGARGGVDLLASLARARLTRGPWERRRLDDRDEGFATFVRRQAGEAAYEQFYRPYAAKVWGVDPELLSQTCAKQRLSSTAPWRLLWGRDRHQFLVPRGGMAAWIAALVRRATEAGVRPRSLAKRFDVNDLAEIEADAVVHTGHLTDVLTPAQRVAAGLAHRGLQLLWLWLLLL